MICLLSENTALKEYLESLLEEYGASVCQNKSDAELLVVDLDTVARPAVSKRVLTISSDPFVFCDLSRPFSQEQFLAFVQEKCERDLLSVAEAPSAEKPKTSLSYEEGVFYLNGERLVLTPAEHRLLRFLYQNRGSAVTVSACADVLGSDAQKGNMTSVYINHLRRKIDYPLQTRMIVTLRGEGYMLIDQ